MAGSGIVVHHFAPFCQMLGFYGAPVKKLCLPNIFECPNKEGLHVDTPIQLCIHFIAQFLGKGCFRLAVQIENAIGYAPLVQISYVLHKTGLIRAVSSCLR